MDEYITCPKCHNPHCQEDDNFCFNCGFELGNCCENPDCELNLGAEDLAELPEDWCFCNRCGKPSRYYAAALIEQLTFE